MKRKLIGVLLAIMVISPMAVCSATEAMPDTAWAQLVPDGKTNRLELIWNQGVDGTEPNSILSYTEFAGEKCLSLPARATILPVDVDDDYISPTDKNVVIKVRYYNRDTDYVKLQYNMQSGTARNILMPKSDTDTWTSDMVILNDAKFSGDKEFGADFYVNGYESSWKGAQEYVTDLEVINLDKLGTNENSDGTKTVTFHEGSARILKSIGLADYENKLDREASREEISRLFYEITGIVPVLPQGELTLGDVLKSYMRAMGRDFADETLISDCVDAGLMRNMNKTQLTWFGVSHFKTQNFGLYDVLVTGAEQKVFYDDLAALAYDMLFMTDIRDGKLFMVKKGAAEPEFEDAVIESNEHDLVYDYYRYAGLRVKEKEVIDEATGNKIRVFYMPGAHMNACYMNEMTTVDGVHFAFVGAYEKQLGVGFPMIYDAETKEVIKLDDRWVCQKFAMVMANTNIAYYVVEDEIWSYNVITGEKKLEFEEPNGYNIQEVPTVTNDGRYLSFFYGTLKFAHPNTVCVLDLETGEVETVVGPQWVKSHFGNKINPFAGHIIINPEDHTLVQYLHGGDNNPDDRMWIVDSKTGKKWEFHKLIRNYTGGLGESATHWFWSWDGTKVYYCRLSNGTATDENGIVYFDLTEPEKGIQCVTNDFQFTHAQVDTSDRYYAGDQIGHYIDDKNNYIGQIALYDKQLDVWRMLAIQPVLDGHPAHPHVTFLPDQPQIIFTYLDPESSLIQVGMMDLEPIYKDMEENGNKNHGKPASIRLGKELTEPYSGMLVNYRTTTNRVVYQDRAIPHFSEVEGVECAMLKDDIKLYLDVSPEYVRASDDKVTLAITYYDNTKNGIKLEYNTNRSTQTSTILNTWTKIIATNGTNKWKTVYVTLTDASFRSAIAGGHDFSIAPVKPEDTLYFSKIQVVAGTDTSCFDESETEYIKEN